MTRRAAVAVAVLIPVLAGGCAAGGGTSAGPASPTTAPPATYSTTPPPTLGPPSTPPKTPSDLSPVDILVGRVVRGGAGPCYGVETDDGVVYAVHSVAGGTLAPGTTVRIHTAPARGGVNCGAGRPIEGLSVTVVN